MVLFKLLYASPAWWGFTSSADKRRLEASVRRAIRLGLYAADDLTPSQLVADMDVVPLREHTRQPSQCLAQISSGQN